jgi:hypothetical protein
VTKHRVVFAEQVAEKAMPGWKAVACASAGPRNVGAQGSILDSVVSTKKKYGFVSSTKTKVKLASPRTKRKAGLLEDGAGGVYVVRMRIKKVAPSGIAKRRALKGGKTDQTKSASKAGALIGEKVVLVAADGKVLGIQG